MDILTRKFSMHFTGTSQKATLQLQGSQDRPESHVHATPMQLLRIMGLCTQDFRRQASVTRMKCFEFEFDAVCRRLQPMQVPSPLPVGMEIFKGAV